MAPSPPPGGCKNSKPPTTTSIGMIHQTTQANALTLAHRFAVRVASPWHRFGAHNRDAFFAAHVNEHFKRVLKLLGLHIIGVAAKASVSPADVGGIFPSAPQTSQRSNMQIFEMLCSQAIG